MSGKIKDILRSIKTVLGAVTMVQVPVDDGNALQTQTLQTKTGPDRNIVKKAKPHGPVRLGMMTGRPHQGKSVVSLTTHYHLHASGHCSSGKTGCII